mmetsp:Transcript_113212/g.354073  ORF Transcript_113212/g.354073 Transcript_113212/m.354073 type:complete len:114 (+) Transcript_113212:470-811(+)
MWKGAGTGAEASTSPRVPLKVVQAGDGLQMLDPLSPNGNVSRTPKTLPQISDTACANSGLGTKEGSEHSTSDAVEAARAAAPAVPGPGTAPGAPRSRDSQPLSSLVALACSSA